MTVARKFGYWLTTGAVALIFFATGIGNLIPINHIAQDLMHLGYPSYFHLILGTWKILGAITIVMPRLPRLKEWAYAGMIFDVTGAAFSRLATGDSVASIVTPLVIACVVLTSRLLNTKMLVGSE